jgi:hypothetical protein
MESITLQFQVSIPELAVHGSRAVFARSEAGTVGSNPTQGMNV